MLPLLLLTIAFAAQDKPPERCTLSGTVVNSVTGEPLAKVDLSLGAVERSTRPVAGTTTDAEGHFKMVDLEPGSYHLSGKRSGYLETAYGSRRAESDGAVLRLEAGESLSNLKLKLVPYAVIAGTIRDSDGEPLAGAEVSVARLTYEYGEPRLETYAGTETDDLGQYRLRDLAPGRYVVGVRPASDNTERIDRSAAAPREISVPTVYPGTADLSLAAPVEVPVGGRITGIDITLAHARTFTIKGRVVTAAGSPAPNSPISLRKRNSNLDLDRSLHTVTRNLQGDFELRGVQAGSYLLTVERNESQTGVRPLEVSADMEGVVAVIGSLAEVRANFVADGETRLPAKPLSVFLRHEANRGYFISGTAPLVQNNVAPDHYEVRVVGPTGGLYVKSIRAGETDVLADGLTVTAGGHVELEITLSADGGKVEGVVLDPNGQPVTGATVLLAPEFRLRSRLDLFRTATTDQYGKYEFLAVTPGDYKVFAWEDVEPGIWHDPGFLKTCEKKGEPVTVKPKSTEVLSRTGLLPCL